MATTLAKRKGKLWLVLGEKIQSQRAAASCFFFFLVEIGKILGLSLCLFFKKFHSSVN
jgi:hypothetical protein